jgi:hypothetical protein
MSMSDQEAEIEMLKRLLFQAQNAAIELAHAAPPRKEWVGLTDEELRRIYDEAPAIEGVPFIPNGFAYAIEAKLKEKNAYGWQSVSNPTEYLDELRGGEDT